MQEFTADSGKKINVTYLVRLCIPLEILLKGICLTVVVISGEWEFPDGSVSVSFWNFDSVVNPAFIPPKLRQEMETAIHKAQVSAVAAGCRENFEVQPHEVLEWRRLRELSVTEAKRKCAVELSLATKKVRTLYFMMLFSALLILIYMSIVCAALGG